MKYILGFLVTALLIFGYLSLSYNRIYHYLDRQTTTSPFTQKRYVLLGQGQQPLKYIALGDDLVAGVGSKDIKKTYPYVVAEALTQRADTLTFINLANPGATTEQVLQNQLAQAIYENPNYITVQVGLNDVHALTSLNKFRENYDQIVTKLASSNAKVLFISIPYLGSPNLVNLPFNVALDIRTRQLNRIIEVLAKQNNLLYFNLFGETFETLSSSSELYSEDLIHPAEKEYVYWGRLISELNSF